MAVIVSDSSNANYDGTLSKANGFYRVEASNLTLFNLTLVSLATEVDISVTFANSGNCKGIILALTYATSLTTDLKSVKVTLQENVAAVWTDRATVTLTAAQIHAITDETVNTTNDLYVIPFTGGTFPYAVDTTAGKWRFAVVSAGTGTNDWRLRASNGTAPFYATWCDNAVSFTSGSDCLIVKDSVTINTDCSLKGVLGTGDPTYSTCCVLCSSTSSLGPTTVSKLLWANPPAAAYTLTMDGVFIFSSHSGFRIGTSASPLPAANPATITVQWPPTLGNAAKSGFVSPGGSKSNLFLFGAVQSVPVATLAVTAAVGATSLTTVETTGWKNGDIIFIGKQNVRGVGEHVYYTLSGDASGTTINLTGAITNYDRLAGAKIIRFAGYAIKMQANSAANNNVMPNSGSLAFSNFQISGAQFDYLSMLVAGTPYDDLANLDTVNGKFFKDSAVRWGTVAVGGQTGLFNIPTHSKMATTVDRIYAANNAGFNVSGLTQTGWLSGVRRIMITNCIFLTPNPTTGGTTFSPSLSGKTVTIQDCIYQNNNGQFISIGAGDVIVSGCNFWGGGSAFGAAMGWSSAFNCIGLNNVYDNNVIALSMTNNVNNVYEINPTFGPVANGTDFDAAYGATSSVNGVVVNPSGLLTTTRLGGFAGVGLANQVCFSGYSGANDDRVFTTAGTIQKTGPGLADTTERVPGTGYAWRFEPVDTFCNPVLDTLMLPPVLSNRIVPTGNRAGQSIAVTAWVMINNAAFYAGSYVLPTLYVKYDLTTTATAVATAAAGSWQQLTVTFTPATSTPFIEVWLGGMTDATGSNAYFYLDDMAVPSLSLNLGTLDISAYGQPLWPPLNTASVLQALVLQTLMAQASPAAVMETALYTVPLTAANTVLSSLTVCNRGSTETTFRFSISPNGAATANKDYIYYDVPIKAKDAFTATLGLTPSAGSAIRVYAGNANLGFSVWGSQNILS